MIVFWVICMHREINGLCNRGAQCKLVRVVHVSITEYILAIVWRVITKHGKGRVVKVLDVDVEISIFNLREIVFIAHKELSIVCFCMISLLTEGVCPATARVTPITFPSLCTPWITQLDKSMLFACIVGHCQNVHYGEGMIVGQAIGVRVLIVSRTCIASICDNVFIIISTD